MSAFLIGLSVFFMVPSAALWFTTMTPSGARQDEAVKINAGSSIVFTISLSLLIATLIGRAFA